MTTKDQCYQLGQITKLHGVRGEMIFFIDADFPEDYEDLESVFVEERGNLVPYFIEDIQVRGNRAIVRLEEIDSVEKATKLLKLDLFLPLDELPELEEGEFYLHDVVGYEVFEGEKSIGNATCVYPMPNQNILGVLCQGKEVLIPMVDSIILNVDRDNKKIDVSLPDGLLEVYLEE